MIEDTNKNIKLIAVYGRVSTSNQENEGTIETQLSAVNQFAKNNGYTIVQQYIDNGWSGDSLARPELDKLREDAKSKIWDAVLIYDPDRLARRYSYQELVMDELKEKGIPVLFVTVPQAKNDEDRIMYGMRGLFSQYERMKIAERFRLGKVRKAKNNHVIASEAPYGYTFVKRNGKPGDTGFYQGYYEINEREAQIVNCMFSWVGDEGLTLRGVVQRLQKLCIPPRKSKRGVWSTSTLSTLFRNKTYIGEAHYGASYAIVPLNPLKKDGYRKIKKTSRKSKPENEWIKITTPKIVEEELFNRVGLRLRSNFEASVRNTKNEYLLSHRIWCPCGCRRAGEGPQKGKHLYYRCTSRVKSFPLASTCPEKGLNARVVDQVVWDKISNLMSSPDLIKKQVERWLTDKNKGSKVSTVNVDDITKEVSKLKDQEDRYAKAYGAGVITIDQLKDYTQPIKDKIIALNNQLTQAQSEIQSTSTGELPRPDKINEFANKAVEALKNLKFSQKQEIVKNIIDKVVGTRESLIISGYIPITSNINVFTIHRHRRSSKRR
ncbi:MAG: recombinase family protein [Patescibacteria group bacterium]